MIELQVVTNKSCSHCKRYIKEAEQYVKKLTILDILQDPSVARVPHSRLFDNGTLVAEWDGMKVDPILAYIGGDNMKIKFTMECRDKYTGETYKRGSTREVAKERAQELIESGVAKVVEKKNDQDNDKQ